MLNKPITESRNKNSYNIDSVSTIDMLKLINNEDKKVALAVEKELDNIANAIDKITDRISLGGRLIYIGAGTSGRLGVLDASECPPTFGTDPELVKAIIAGGMEALLYAIEGAEDNGMAGRDDLLSINLNSSDAVVGIAASGNTPYVIEAIKYANSINALTIGLNNNPDSDLNKLCDIAIVPVVGAEVVTGSTRMKAGTAQKMVLNMISTGTMIKYGKVYGNLMVDVKATNNKLVTRAQEIVVEATGVSLEDAKRVLKKTDYNCKLAIFIIMTDLNNDEAKRILDLNNGYLRKALDFVKER